MYIYRKMYKTQLCNFANIVKWSEYNHLLVQEVASVPDQS